MSQSNRVKVTIIGCGGMARHHIRRMLLQQGTTEIAVVCEPSPGAYAATADETTVAEGTAAETTVDVMTASLPSAMAAKMMRRIPRQ